MVRIRVTFRNGQDYIVGGFGAGRRVYRRGGVWSRCADIGMAFEGSGGFMLIIFLLQHQLVSYAVLLFSPSSSLGKNVFCLKFKNIISFCPAKTTHHEESRERVREERSGESIIE